MSWDIRAYSLPGDTDAKRLKERLAKDFGLLSVQVADSAQASNEAFLEMLCAQTVESKKRGTLLAKGAEMDLLLRVAGTTQISEAISRAGAKKGEPSLLIMFGDRALISRVDVSAFGKPHRLPRVEPGTEELGRIEAAAILNAGRG